MSIPSLTGSMSLYALSDSQFRQKLSFFQAKGVPKVITASSLLFLEQKQEIIGLS